MPSSFLKSFLLRIVLIHILFLCSALLIMAELQASNMVDFAKKKLIIELTASEADFAKKNLVIELRPSDETNSSPKKRCFFCIPLRTGMILTCWMSLLWNLHFLSRAADENQRPVLFEFFDQIPQMRTLIDGWNYSDLIELYYIVQIVIIVLALIGVHEDSLKSPIYLFPQVVNEFVMITLYLCISMAHACGYEPFQNTSISFNSLVFILAYRQCVCFMIILKYLNEYLDSYTERLRAVIRFENLPKQTTQPQQAICKPSPCVDSLPSAHLLYPVLGCCNEREAIAV